MNIRIISDYGEVYESGTVLSLENLKKDYEEANWTDEHEENAIDWGGWTEKEILDFIAVAWGLECEIV